MGTTEFSNSRIDVSIAILVNVAKAIDFSIKFAHPTHLFNRRGAESAERESRILTSQIGLLYEFISSDD